MAIKVEFPYVGFPEDLKRAKFLGIYPQVQAGRWMQRVKILGGILTPPQWHALAAMARRFTPNTPLHLTARQVMEFHDLRQDELADVQRALHEAGLHSDGAGGDGVRNVTVCTCSGVRAGRVDLMPLARQIPEVLAAAPEAGQLGRKFKIGLSACENACSRPFLNDLGLVARMKDGRWGFKVIVAGSLGAIPATGIVFREWIDADEALPLALAALRVFAAHGEKTNRTKARLRHVRQRMGDEPFAALLTEAFDLAKAECQWPAVHLDAPASPFVSAWRLTFANGDLTPDAADAIGELAAGGRVVPRIGIDQRVMLYHQHGVELAEVVADKPALSEAARPQPSIVACPGKRWCQRALVDTNAMANRLRRQLPQNATIHISGCPNGCTHTAVAVIGLSGLRVSRDGQHEEAFKVLTGGELGRTDKMAQPLDMKLSADEAVRAVRTAACNDDQNARRKAIRSVS